MHNAPQVVQQASNPKIFVLKIEGFWVAQKPFLFYTDHNFGCKPLNLFILLKEIKHSSLCFINETFQDDKMNSD